MGLRISVGSKMMLYLCRYGSVCLGIICPQKTSLLPILVTMLPFSFLSTFSNKPWNCQHIAYPYVWRIPLSQSPFRQDVVNMRFLSIITDVYKPVCFF